MALTDAILLEDGSRLLQENGGSLHLESATTAYANNINVDTVQSTVQPAVK